MTAQLLTINFVKSGLQCDSEIVVGTCKPLFLEHLARFGGYRTDSK